MRVGLTRQQRDCLDAIQRLTVDDISPSYEELGVALGLASKAGVHRLVTGLKERGYITSLSGQSRSLRVLDPTENDNHSVFDRAEAAIKTVARVHGSLAASKLCRNIADRLEAALPASASGNKPITSGVRP